MTNTVKKKQFQKVLNFTGSLSGDSIKKEKLISSYSETMPLKTETGNSYCECLLRTSTKQQKVVWTVKINH